MWKNRITGDVFEDKDLALADMVERYTTDIHKALEGDYTVSDLLGILWSVAIGEDDPGDIEAQLSQAWEDAAMAVFDEYYAEVNVKAVPQHPPVRVLPLQ